MKRTDCPSRKIRRRVRSPDAPNTTRSTASATCRIVRVPEPREYLRSALRYLLVAFAGRRDDVPFDFLPGLDCGPPEGVPTAAPKIRGRAQEVAAMTTW